MLSIKSTALICVAAALALAQTSFAADTISLSDTFNRLTSGLNGATGGIFDGLSRGMGSTFGVGQGDLSSSDATSQHQQQQQLPSSPQGLNGMPYQNSFFNQPGFNPPPFGLPPHHHGHRGPHHHHGPPPFIFEQLQQQQQDILLIMQVLKSLAQYLQANGMIPQGSSSLNVPTNSSPARPSINGLYGFSNTSYNPLHQNGQQYPSNSNGQQVPASNPNGQQVPASNQHRQAVPAFSASSQ